MFDEGSDYICAPCCFNLSVWGREGGVIVKMAVGWGWEGGVIVEPAVGWRWEGSGWGGGGGVTGLWQRVFLFMAVVTGSSKFSDSVIAILSFTLPFFLRGGRGGV